MIPISSAGYVLKELSRVGGTKKRQQQDIDLAVDRWEEHKRRKARTS